MNIRSQSEFQSKNTLKLKCQQDQILVIKMLHNLNNMSSEKEGKSEVVQDYVQNDEEGVELMRAVAKAYV